VGDIGVLVHNLCAKSSINQSSSSLKEASNLIGRVQDEADDLVKSFLSGYTSPGIGTKQLAGDIF